MTGHEPLPDLDSIKDEYEIIRWFRHGEFPDLEAVLAGQIMLKCWTLAYLVADECVEELKGVAFKNRATSTPIRYCRKKLSTIADKATYRYNYLSRRFLVYVMEKCGEVTQRRYAA